MRRPAWDFDCAIIGGGPGGLVSALYLGRFRRKVALINSGKPRAAWIPRTHNLLGYDKGISGECLLRRLHRQVSALGTEKIKAHGTLSRYRDGFEVDVGQGRVIRARKAIIATGIQDVQPEIDNVRELRERGLLRYCSICDGYEYRDHPIAVLAKDDFGIRKALFISHWTRDLRIVIPEDLVLAPQRVIEIRRIRAKVSRCKTLKMLPASAPVGLRLFLDARKPIYCRAAYIELGCEVSDSAYRGLKKLRRTKEGFIVTTIEQRTTIPGLFAVGDCVNLLGQLSVAAGQAAVAATTIHNDLLDCPS